MHAASTFDGVCLEAILVSNKYASVDDTYYIILRKLVEIREQSQEMLLDFIKKLSVFKS